MVTFILSVLRLLAVSSNWGSVRLLFLRSVMSLKRNRNPALVFLSDTLLCKLFESDETDISKILCSDEAPVGVDGAGGEDPTPEPRSRPFLTQLESLPYDERPLPVTRKQPGRVAAEPEPERSTMEPAEAPRGGVVGEPEPLTEKALREASSAVDVLGEALVRREAPAHQGWAGTGLVEDPGRCPPPLSTAHSRGNHSGTNKTQHRHQLQKISRGGTLLIHSCIFFFLAMRAEVPGPTTKPMSQQWPHHSRNHTRSLTH